MRISDDYSRHKHVYLMKTKDEALYALKDYCRHVGNPKQVLTDKDKAFIGNPFAHYCLDNKIDQRKFPAYRASFNGLVVRSNKELKEIARATLLDSGLPPQFWGYTLKASMGRRHTSSCPRFKSRLTSSAGRGRHQR